MRIGSITLVCTLRESGHYVIESRGDNVLRTQPFAAAVRPGQIILAAARCASFDSIERRNLLCQRSKTNGRRASGRWFEPVLFCLVRNYLPSRIAASDSFVSQLPILVDIAFS
jgi:hypothetical protein